MSKTVEAAPARRHPNRITFKGILAPVEQVSDKLPGGSRGRRIILSREAVEDALWSLKGMGVDYVPTWEGHDSKMKIGVIEDAWLDGSALWVSGYIYARDFPELLAEMYDPKRPLGMSYEMADAFIEDTSAAHWRLIRFTFTGAAILYCDKAAYKSTSFMLDRVSASEEEFTGRISFVETGEVTGTFEAEDRQTIARETGG